MSAPRPRYTRRRNYRVAQRVRVGYGWEGTSSYEETMVPLLMLKKYVAGMKAKKPLKTASRPSQIGRLIT